MKKILSVCLALCLAFTLAAPALAETVPLAPAALEAAPVADAPAADAPALTGSVDAPAGQPVTVTQDVEQEKASGPVTVTIEDDLRKAFEEATGTADAPTEIVLGADIALTKPYEEDEDPSETWSLQVNKGQYILLDLNGFTLEVKTLQGIEIEGGFLTLADRSEQQTGVMRGNMSNAGASGYAVVVAPDDSENATVGGTFCLKSGTIRDFMIYTLVADGVWNAEQIDERSPKIVIEGGEIIGSEQVTDPEVCPMAVGMNSCAILEMKGGTISGFCSETIIRVSRGSHASLTGGTIENCKTEEAVVLTDGDESTLTLTGVSIENCSIAEPNGAVVIADGNVNTLTLGENFRINQCRNENEDLPLLSFVLKYDSKLALEDASSLSRENCLIGLMSGAQIVLPQQELDARVGLLVSAKGSNAAILVDDTGAEVTDLALLHRFYDYLKEADGTTNRLISSLLKDGALQTENACLIEATAGEGGTISPSGTVAAPLKGDQTFTITPAEGYEIASLTVDGAEVEPAATYTFKNVETTHTIAAAFEKLPEPEPEDPGTPVVPDTSITLDKDTLALEPGDVEKLYATVKPSNATYKVVFWESSDPEIVAVNQSGVVMALADGEAVITATSWYGNTDTCAITVETPQPEEPTDPETPEDPDEPNEEIKDFVRRCYLIALDREPDAQGYADWTRWLADGTVDGKGCVYGFIFSREMEDKNLSDADFIETLYWVLLDRPNDEDGKAFWVNYLAEGHTRLEVFLGFADSIEFIRLMDSYGVKHTADITFPGM